MQEKKERKRDNSAVSKEKTTIWLNANLSTCQNKWKELTGYIDIHRKDKSTVINFHKICKQKRS